MEPIVKASGNLEIGDEFNFADVYRAKVVSKEKADKNQITIGIKWAGAHGNLRGMTLTMPKSIPLEVTVGR